MIKIVSKNLIKEDKVEEFKSLMKELVEKQRELSENTALSSETAQRIASEIIDQLTEKKKAELEKKSKADTE